MITSRGSFKSRRFSLLVFFGFPALFFLLYRLRSFDDSRMTSWNDVFTVVDASRVSIALCLGLIAAFLCSRMERIYTHPSVFLGILSFSVSALFWQEPEMIVDASRYFIYAKYLEMNGVEYFFREWGRGISTWTDLPAIPFLYGMIFRIFGESRVYIQIFNSFLFSMTIILACRTGRELWNKDVGTYAGMLLLGIPYLYTQTPLMLVDMACMFFVILSVYSFLLAVRRGGIMVPLSALSIFITFFTKYSTWLMLTVIPVTYAVELYRSWKEGPERPALRGMIVFFVSFFLISLAVAFKHDEIMQQIHLLISYQKPGLQRWGESLGAIYLFQVHPVIVLFAMISPVIALRRLDASYLIVFWLVLVMLLLQVSRIRYLIMVFPFLCLMAAYGISLIKDKTHARYLACSVIAFSVTIALSGFLPFLQHISAANFRDAGRYLDSLDAKTIKAITPLPDAYVMNPAVSVPLLDLFTEKKIVYQYEPQEYPRPADIVTSRLRFTWEYANPDFYQGTIQNPKAVVVIGDKYEAEDAAEIHQETEGLSKRAFFSIRDSVFEHQTLITVYH